jgi:hypothetical protein
MLAIIIRTKVHILTIAHKALQNQTHSSEVV